MPRAKLRWNDERRNITGSHVGSVGNLTVSGSMAKGYGTVADGKDKLHGGFNSAGEMTGGTGTDGSIAYRELLATDDPYAADFDVGTVTVGEVETVKNRTVKDASGNARADPAERP